MFDYIYADFVLFLNVHFATSTLQNELLVINEQQKVGFMLIFAAKIEKMQNMRALFRFFGIIGVRELAIYKTKSFTETYKVIHRLFGNSLFSV